MGSLQETTLCIQIVNCMSVSIANSFISTVIICQPRLRGEKPLLLMSYYCSMDAQYAMSAGLLAIRRLMVFLDPEGYPFIPRFKCISDPIMMMVLFSYMAVPLGEITLTLDRLTAIYAPIVYQSANIKGVIGSLIGITVFSLLFVAFCVWHVSISESINISPGCYGDSYTDLVFDLAITGKAVLFAVCIVIYLPIIYKIIMLSRDHTINQGMRSVVRTSLILGILMIGLMLLLIIPSLIVVVFPSGQAFQSLFMNLALTKPWLNVFVALFSFSNLRTEIVRLFRRVKRKRSATVTAATVHRLATVR